jgi:hypothetical protein
MSQLIASVPSRRTPLLLLLAALVGIVLYHYLQQPARNVQQLTYAGLGATATVAYAHQVITTDLEIDWTPGSGGDFDPRGKCPDDFFGQGFILLCKRLGDGSYVKFLFHKGKNLLYRIDRDVIKDKVSIGLHWVTGTRYNAKYRIADPGYKGGRTIEVPTAKGTSASATFEYGQAVSKKRVQPGRELFRETHIAPGQCREWWEVWDFIP